MADVANGGLRVIMATDPAQLERVAPDVFDCPVDTALCEAFLADPRHHLALATDSGTVVGFCSGTRIAHPDKPDQLFINELGVAMAYRRRGLARQLVRMVLDVAQGHGCSEAWVLADSENAAAHAVYAGAGGSASPGGVMFSFALGGAQELASTVKSGKAASGEGKR